MTAATIDAARVLFGDQARHVPAWLYVQNQGEGIVSFTGASRVDPAQLMAGVHPLRYGSVRTHQFIVGEVIVRPHLVVATDTLRGRGIAGLLNSSHDVAAMLAAGETLIEREV